MIKKFVVWLKKIFKAYTSPVDLPISNNINLLPIFALYEDEQITLLGVDFYINDLHWGNGVMWKIVRPCGGDWDIGDCSLIHAFNVWEYTSGKLVKYAGDIFNKIPYKLVDKFNKEELNNLLNLYVATINEESKIWKNLELRKLFGEDDKYVQRPNVDIQPLAHIILDSNYDV